MSVSNVKDALDVIVRVSRLDNKLLLYSARLHDVPKRVIMLDRLKSIAIDLCTTNKYTLRFEFVGSDNAEIIRMPYMFDEHDWEEDMKNVLRDVVRLA